MNIFIDQNGNLYHKLDDADEVWQGDYQLIDGKMYPIYIPDGIYRIYDEQDEPPIFRKEVFNEIHI